MSHEDIMKAHSETLQRLDNNYERVAVALEQLARRGAQVDNLEKSAERNQSSIQIAFSQVREIDKRVTVLEMDKSYHEGSEQAEEKGEVIWTKLQRVTLVLQIFTPCLFGLFFLFWMLDKYELAQSVAALFREMVGR